MSMGSPPNEAAPPRRASRSAAARSRRSLRNWTRWPASTSCTSARAASASSRRRSIFASACSSAAVSPPVAACAVLSCVRVATSWALSSPTAVRASRRASLTLRFDSSSRLRSSSIWCCALSALRSSPATAAAPAATASSVHQPGGRFRNSAAGSFASIVSASFSAALSRSHSSSSSASSKEPASGGGSRPPLWAATRLSPAGISSPSRSRSAARPASMAPASTDCSGPGKRLMRPSSRADSPTHSHGYHWSLTQDGTVAYSLSDN